MIFNTISTHAIIPLSWSVVLSYVLHYLHMRFIFAIIKSVQLVWPDLLFNIKFVIIYLTRHRDFCSTEAERSTLRTRHSWRSSSSSRHPRLRRTYRKLPRRRLPPATGRSIQMSPDTASAMTCPTVIWLAVITMT